MENDQISYTPVLDEKPAILLLPQVTFLVGASLFVIASTLYALLATVQVYLPLWLFFFIWLAPTIAHWVIVGDNPERIMGQLHQDKLRQTANTRIVNRPKDKLKVKVKPTTIGPKSSRRTVVAAENDTDLCAIIDFQIGGYKVGAYLLQSGERLQVVWVFNSTGIPSTTTKSQGKAIAERLEEGLRDLTIGESLTMHMGSFSDCRERVKDINQQAELAPLKESTFLLSWIRKRVKALKRLGRYNPKFLRFYVNHDLGAFGRHQNFFSGLAQSVHDEWQRRRGQAPSLNENLHRLLVEAFEDSFYSNQRFFHKCGLPAQTMNAEEVWKIAYRQFNDDEVPPIPQLITITADQIIAKKHSNKTIASILFRQTPDYGKSMVWLPGRQVYAGGIVLEDRPNRTYDPVEGRLDQLLDASSPIIGDKGAKTNDATDLHDLEIVVTFKAEPQKKVLKNTQRLTGQSNQSLVMTENRKRLDGGAIFNTQESLSAEMKLRHGGHTLKIGWMAIAYRKNKQQLRRALNTLESIPIFSGGKVRRETGYFDCLFLESLPIKIDVLLAGTATKITERFDRHIRETTRAAPGLMPLILDSRSDKQGVEVLSRSGSPMKIDPMGRFPHNHMLIIARTRAGKSVFVQGFSSDVLSRPNSQVIIIDAGRDDGSGSFDTFTDYMDCSHFKAGQDSYNLFQTPNPASMDAEKYEIAETTYRKFLLAALVSLTTSADDADRLINFYGDILTNLISTFLTDEGIKERYRLAYKDGFGSESWLKMPCLPNFVEFMSVTRLPAELQNPDAEKAIQNMKMSLAALMQRQAGKAISQPSTFRADKPLVVYALGSVSNDADMVPALLAAQSSMLAQTFTRKQTYVVAEEATHLWKFPSYRTLVSEWFTGKAKSGVWICWVGQSLEIMLQHKEASSILDNVGTILVGWIRPGAVKTLASAGLDPELVQQCTHAKFNPSQEADICEYATQWLIETDGAYHFGYYYPDFASLGLTMNNPDEVDLRKEIYDQAGAVSKYQKVAAVAAHLESSSIDTQGVY